MRKNKPKEALPDEEEAIDEEIIDLRHFEPGTELHVQSMPEEGYEIDTFTID